MDPSVFRTFGGVFGRGDPSRVGRSFWRVFLGVRPKLGGQVACDGVLEGATPTRWRLRWLAEPLRARTGRFGLLRRLAHPGPLPAPAVRRSSLDLSEGV